MVLLRGGRAQGDRGGAGGGLEASKQWIRESINLQRQLVEAYTAARGPIETIPYPTFTDYEDDVWARVEAVGTDPSPRPTW